MAQPTVNIALPVKIKHECPSCKAFTFLPTRDLLFTGRSHAPYTGTHACGSCKAEYKVTVGIQ